MGAEFIGTLGLVLGGCGAAVLAADFGTGANGTSLGLGYVGVSLAFGLTVLTGAYALGHIVGAVLVYLIAGTPDIDGSEAGAFAANGYGDLSPNGSGVGTAFITEVVMTAMFLIVIMGATARKAAPAMGGLAIGLMLTLIHLISIPVTNTSVNPARSTSQAIFAGGDYIPQLWLFWIAPILGAVIGAVTYRVLLGDEEDLAV